MQCKAAVQTARNQVANMIGAHSDEVFFTSSGTESDHWAIWGARSCTNRPHRDCQTPHIVTSAIEHPAVLQYLDSLQQEASCSSDICIVACSSCHAYQLLSGLTKAAFKEPCRLKPTQSFFPPNGVQQFLAHTIAIVKAISPVHTL